jgi:hypothetical protein
LIKQWKIELKQFNDILELIKNKKKTEKEVEVLEVAKTRFLKTYPDPNKRFKDRFLKEIETPLSQKKDLLKYISRYTLENVNNEIKSLEEKIKDCPKHAEKYIKTLQKQYSEKVDNKTPIGAEILPSNTSQTDDDSYLNPFVPLPAPPPAPAPTDSPAPSRNEYTPFGGHSTRRHFDRSRPSRFKMHKTYGLH